VNPQAGGDRRICMYTPTAEGGHARYVWELLRAMTQQSSGYRVELVSSEDLDPQFQCDLYPIHPILAKLRHRAEYSSRLAWLIGRITHYARREMAFLRWLCTRPDIEAVHFQEWTLWLAAPLVRRIRAMGKRVIYTAHNIAPHKYPALLPRWIVNHWIRSACRNCDCIFVHSEQLALQMAHFLQQPHPPIHVVPHGVWIMREIPDASPIEQRLDTRRLLFFGTIRRNKGLHLLLRAMPLLPEYTLTIVGEPLDSGYFHNEIEPLVKQLKASGAKIEMNPQFIAEDEIAALLARHSAIVLPYTQEFVAQSGVAFMALACELPVICSEAGGLAELMRQFNIGGTYAQQTPQALAAAARQLHEKHDRADWAGKIGAAKQRYSWRTAAQETFRGYSIAFDSAMVRDDCAVATTSA
jgi:glycosyltransferase involved in cell wall biosynthesis